MRTLEEALAEVARRSFDEDVTVYPVTDPRNGNVLGYVWEDDCNIIPTDEIGWTYADGVDRGPETDWSRLMDPCETFTTAGHVRYNLSRAVADLEDGRPVSFAYGIVRDSSLTWDEDSQTYSDADGELCADNFVGWVLLALTLD